MDRAKVNHVKFYWEGEMKQQQEEDWGLKIEFFVEFFRRATGICL